VEDLDRHIGRVAAQQAYEAAGVGPDEIGVAEVHDACSFAEIVQTENLGFCERGGGGPLAERGETRLGGRIPVNPSGGLVSKGHPVGATGLIQLHELVTQLRGDAGKRQVEEPRFAIAENGGGFWGVEEAATTVTILERPHRT
jgi:acetyl-CoA acetyltransferase